MDDPDKKKTQRIFRLIVYFYKSRTPKFCYEIWKNLVPALFWIPSQKKSILASQGRTEKHFKSWGRTGKCFMSRGRTEKTPSNIFFIFIFFLSFHVFMFSAAKEIINNLEKMCFLSHFPLFKITLQKRCQIRFYLSGLILKMYAENIIFNDDHLESWWFVSSYSKSIKEFVWEA